eukprot:9118764-Pyramimonas_sp.AAC.1
MAELAARRNPSSEGADLLGLRSPCRLLDARVECKSGPRIRRLWRSARGCMRRGHRARAS